MSDHWLSDYLNKHPELAKGLSEGLSELEVAEFRKSFLEQAKKKNLPEMEKVGGLNSVEQKNIEPQINWVEIKEEPKKYDYYQDQDNGREM